MNWDVIGAVATVLGVLGGFVSVYFLIHEVRRNAQAVEGSTVQALMNFEQSVFALMIDGAAVFTKGCQDRDSLTPEARFKFDMLVQSYMSLQYSAFKQFEQELIDPEVWHAYENALRAKLVKPGYLASWTEMRASYPVTFQQSVARVLASLPQDSA
jgi:hypothetical protein